MIQNNPFVKRLMKDDKKEDIFHSSMYGRAQSGEGLGVASTTGYQARRTLDSNRQMVRGYGDSEIANGAKSNRPRAKVYTPPEGAGNATARAAAAAAAPRAPRAPQVPRP